MVGMSDKEAFELTLVENLQIQKFNPVVEALTFKKYVCEPWRS
jgi:hypothetical protein